MARPVLGSKVRLRHDITTRGGTTFRAGLEMRVVNSTRSGFDLRVYKRGFYCGINHVERHSFDIIEYPEKESE